MVFRLGRLVGARGPGIDVRDPGVEQMERVDLRTVTMDVPPQDVITKRQRLGEGQRGALLPRRRPAARRRRGGGLPVRHLAACADDAAQRLRPGASSTSCWPSATEINQKLQEILDSQTDPWGIKVITVEIKHIDLPQEMQRAMARQAEAERERRAKVINAEGEFQAAQRLAEAVGDHRRPPDRAAAALPADPRRDRHEHNSTTSSRSRSTCSSRS